MQLVEAKHRGCYTARRMDFIVSYVGGSLATLGTPLEVEFCYVSSVCYQAAPCYSDQGANFRQQV